MTKILLVEDILDNASLVRKALSGRNYEIIHALDAETGLSLALEHVPNLILLDLGLPDYDGQTLAGWMRAESVLDATPIVAVTAWPEETAKKMVESYGFDGYICKPILKVAEFVAKIDSYLKVP